MVATEPTEKPIIDLACIHDKLRRDAIRLYGRPSEQGRVNQLFYDARTVGRYLVGDRDTVLDMMHRDTIGFYKGEFDDICLYSLILTLTEWRRRSDAGTLPRSTPTPAPTGTGQPIGDLADYLTILGMWGKATEYQHPTEVSEAGRAFLDIPEMVTLPGWTEQRLCELFAMGYEKIESEAK